MLHNRGTQISQGIFGSLARHDASYTEFQPKLFCDLLRRCNMVAIRGTDLLDLPHKLVITGDHSLRD